MSNLNKILKNAFEDALKQSDSVVHLRNSVKEAISKGYEREEILSEFELLRKETSNEEDEDVLLDVMDFIAGWCSPHMKI